MKMIDEIALFLEENGFGFSRQMREGLDVLCVTTLDGHYDRVILPLEITAAEPKEAARQAEETENSIRMINSYDGEYPLTVARDRWERQRGMMQKRILSHLELFTPVYARNCEIRRIDKKTAADFLEQNHSYGDAVCKYRYGMFLKRHTGHIAEEGIGEGLDPGTMIAVATFSNARKWKKGDKEIRSYEWTRFASLPQLRISGGMGRFLKHFIREVQPDDIMSYADLEWSKGDVYMRLGFTLEGRKDPVTFVVDTDTWKRTALKKSPASDSGLPKGSRLSDTTRSAAQRSPLSPSGDRNCTARYFRNSGSNKFRLKLTDYE